MAFNLPTEVITHILEFLATPTDVHALVITSLVSRKWCRLSQRILWHSPCIRDNLAWNQFIKMIQIPEHKRYCEQIKTMDLTHLSSHLIDVSNLQLMITQCTKLQILRINCQNLHSINGLAVYIGTYLPHLQILSLLQAQTLVDSSLKSIASGCQQLKSLELINAHLISNESIQYLISTCIRLNYLNLSQCPSLTGDLLYHIGNSLIAPNLHYLSIGGTNHQVNSKHLNYFLSSCQELKVLDLSKIEFKSSISPSSSLHRSSSSSSFLEISKHIPKSLQTLKLMDTMGISMNELISIKKSCLNLELELGSSLNQLLQCQLNDDNDDDSYRSSNIKTMLTRRHDSAFFSSRDFGVDFFCNVNNTGIEIR